MADKPKNKLGKNLFVIGTLALSVGVMLYFLFTTDGITTLGKIIVSLRLRWLFLAIGAAFACWFLEAWVLNRLCRHFIKQWKYTRSFTVGMIGFLYSALTPFATGGQPMQIYAMNAMGMDAGMAGSIIAVKSLTYQIVMVAYSLVAVALKLHYFQTSVSNFAFVTLLGLTANCVYIALIALFLISERTTDKLLHGSIRVLHKMKLCRHPEERYEKIHRELQMFHGASRLMGHSTGLYAVVMAVTAVQVTVNSLIPYFIYRSFNMGGASVVTMVAAQVFAVTISSFVPLPGASGGAEGCFYLFFAPYFQAAIIPAILLWRIITYYFNIAFGGIFAYIGSKQNKIVLKNPTDNPLNKD